MGATASHQEDQKIQITPWLKGPSPGPESAPSIRKDTPFFLLAKGFTGTFLPSFPTTPRGRYQSIDFTDGEPETQRLWELRSTWEVMTRGPAPGLLILAQHCSPAPLLSHPCILGSGIAGWSPLA